MYIFDSIIIKQKHTKNFVRLLFKTNPFSNRLIFLFLFSYKYKKLETFLSMFKQKLNLFLLLTLIILFVLLLTKSISSIFYTMVLQPTSSEIFSTRSSQKYLSSPATIVIDAGHGGSDPGKVGVAGTLEKDINLKIALYLKEMLETQDIEVIMTRDKDEELSTNSTNRKASDMKERVALIQESNANAVISIHQNSYTDPKVYGAQCFYYTNSEEGETLASMIQKQIISSTKQTKIREIKSNNDYYLLKHSTLPTVIVECGFLSNPEEENLLLNDEYQRKMAWAIHLGILQYLHQNQN